MSDFVIAKLCCNSHTHSFHDSLRLDIVKVLECPNDVVSVVKIFDILFAKLYVLRIDAVPVIASIDPVLFVIRWCVEISFSLAYLN